MFHIRKYLFLIQIRDREVNKSITDLNGFVSGSFLDMFEVTDKKTTDLLSICITVVLPRASPECSVSDPYSYDTDPDPAF